MPPFSSLLSSSVGSGFSSWESESWLGPWPPTVADSPSGGAGPPRHSPGGPGQHPGYCQTSGGGFLSSKASITFLGARGTSLSCLARSLFFLLKWIQEFSRAVRKRLISPFHRKLIYAGPLDQWGFFQSMLSQLRCLPLSQGPEMVLWGLVLSSQTRGLQT